jgi:hypothetical protein
MVMMRLSARAGRRVAAKTFGTLVKCFKLGYVLFITSLRLVHGRYSIGTFIASEQD